jgi:hypothetical protein
MLWALLQALTTAAPLVAVQQLELTHTPAHFSKKATDEIKADLWRMVAKTGVAFIDTDSDCHANDECLRGAALKANTLYAMSTKIDVTNEGLVTATVHIARNDGESVKTSSVEASMKPDNFAEIGKVALAQALEQLNLTKLPKANECVPDKAWHSTMRETLHELGYKAANKYERENWERYDSTEYRSGMHGGPEGSLQTETRLQALTRALQLHV